MKWFKLFAVLALLALVVSLAPSIARAQGPSPNGGRGNPTLIGNGWDPYYVPTPQELKALAAKEAAALKHVQQLREARRTRPLNTGVNALNVSVYKEPNDAAHDNYCGPGATLVILSARLSYSQVNIAITGIANPTNIQLFNQVGTDEKINTVVPGVTNTAVRDELNRILSTGFYAYQTSASSSQLATEIIQDIDQGWAMDTSMYTGGMPGWNAGTDVAHIVAIRGYYTPDYQSGNAYYTETSSSHAGYNGNFYQYQDFTSFYRWVSAHNGSNNTQVW